MSPKANLPFRYHFGKVASVIRAQKRSSAYRIRTVRTHVSSRAQSSTGVLFRAQTHLWKRPGAKVPSVSAITISLPASQMWEGA